MLFKLVNYCINIWLQIPEFNTLLHHPKQITSQFGKTTQYNHQRNASQHKIFIASYRRRRYHLGTIYWSITVEACLQHPRRDQLSISVWSGDATHRAPTAFRRIPISSFGVNWTIRVIHRANIIKISLFPHHGRSSSGAHKSHLAPNQATALQRRLL